jgi:hypothetical protein
MDDIIYINFNRIKSEIIFNLIDNGIIVKIINYNNIILLNNIYDVNYYIDNTYNKQIYYIKIQSGIKNILNTTNFLLNLPKNYYFQYTNFENETEKSIIIYKKYNYLPLIYLGLPNNKFVESFKVIYNYVKIGSTNTTNCLDSSGNEYCCIDCSGNYDGTSIQYITMFNNYFGNNNYYNNTLELSGDIYQLCIANNSGITSYDSITDTTNNYDLFKIKNNMDITIDNNIYFYDCSSNKYPLSYIINLNTYNYDYNLKNSIFEEYDNIIFNINYIDISGNICIDISGNIYENVLSLNLQTFDPEQLCINTDISGNNYYNTLFFYNYFDDNCNINTINMFDYDYEKYFINTRLPVELFNINLYQIDLYDQIILTDANLSLPNILNIINSYLFINLDDVQLQKNIINPELINNVFYTFTKSNKINLDIIISYLINFTIKKYNVFKITNLLNYNTSTNNTSTNTNKIINLNNNIVNCIKCKIVFYYSSKTNIQTNGTYSFDAKLFLNNYNLQLYHKKYDFENISSNEQKRNLVNMLLFLCSTTYQIKLYFYNKKNTAIPSIYLFNEVNLLKNNNNFNIQFDILPLNNTYTSGYLQLNTQINIQYYILFLYANNNTILNQANFDELTFYSNGVIFKLFKINSPNGNLYKDRILFYICFQNLEELNIFMEFIKVGVINTKIIENNNLSNYFNIQNSIPFYNYYDLNYYWVSDDSPTIFNSSQVINRYEINFSINNLYVNQIYLYGDLFINVI